MRADGPGRASAPERPPIRRYEDIEAYQRAMHVLRPLHRIVRNFPVHETYELGSQLRRASKSVPANIAEGYGKKRSIKEFKAYLNNALGSANEVVVHLKIAEALEYASADDVGSLIDGYTIVAKQLHRLIQRWQGFTPSGDAERHPASRFPLPQDQKAME